MENLPFRIAFAVFFAVAGLALADGPQYLSTSDDWDFTPHKNKPEWWNLVFEEWQEGIAELYSYIVNDGEAGHGTPFSLSGRVCKGYESFRAVQYRE